jgi:uncharacterized membrane protein YeaQ/YmgE (transglycosylase-associated protein family)
MSIIVWLLVGGIVGWLASLLAGTDAEMGIVANILVGVVGAFLGGLISQAVGFGPMNVLTFGGFVFALLGALILLGIVRAVRSA